MYIYTYVYIRIYTYVEKHIAHAAAWARLGRSFGLWCKQEIRAVVCLWCRSCRAVVCVTCFSCYRTSFIWGVD